MIPKTLSATSLGVAEDCPARYKAEYIDYARNFQGDAANVGIVCHGTYEDFLRGVFIKGDMEWNETNFWACFHKHADKVLGPDRTDPLYKDAYEICKRWFYRDRRYEDLAAGKILSLEDKNYFMLKTSKGDIKVNYIMDRLDQVSEGVYRVVDYKSNRVALTATQLKRKLQARLYALMVQIKYPKATEIWVQFDFLRHEPVEVKFTRDDNVLMYRELVRRAEDILAMDENKLQENLNENCGYCVRKSVCKTLISHVAGGGVLGRTIDELAVLHHKIKSQQKAQEILLNEIEGLLLREAIEHQILEYETDDAVVTVKAPVKRSVDSEMAALIVGPELVKDYQKFSPTDIDNIIKRGLIVGPKADLLRATVTRKVGEPSIKVEYTGH
jgi:hypothetical protein